MYNKLMEHVVDWFDYIQARIYMLKHKRSQNISFEEMKRRYGLE